MAVDARLAAALRRAESREDLRPSASTALLRGERSIQSIQIPAEITSDPGRLRKPRVFIPVSIPPPKYFRMDVDMGGGNLGGCPTA